MSFMRCVPVLAAVFFGPLACGRQDRAASEVEPTPVQVAAVERVEASTVCMMNDRFMNAPQIPVKVDGKTYYGCCPMCEERLKTDASIRTAIDPVSKRRVDKATAVIGKLQSGKVLYFESEDSLRLFSPS
jgi:YHS domain-containing protein